MDIRVTGNNVSISTALNGYAERNVRAAMEGGIRHIGEIAVRLSDVNGPRGGIDKLCGIRVVLHRGGVIFVRASGGDAYATVEKAAARLRAALRRRIGRHRAARRRPA